MAFLMFLAVAHAQDSGLAGHYEGKIQVQAGKRKVGPAMPEVQIAFAQCTVCNGKGKYGTKKKKNAANPFALKKPPE